MTGNNGQLTTYVTLPSGLASADFTRVCVDDSFSATSQPDGASVGPFSCQSRCLDGRIRTRDLLSCTVASETDRPAVAIVVADGLQTVVWHYDHPDGGGRQYVAEGNCCNYVLTIQVSEGRYDVIRMFSPTIDGVLDAASATITWAGGARCPVLANAMPRMVHR